MATRLGRLFRRQALHYVGANNSSRPIFLTGLRFCSNLSPEAGPAKGLGFGSLILGFGLLHEIYDWVDPEGLEAKCKSLDGVYCRIKQMAMMADLEKAQREVDALKSRTRACVDEGAEGLSKRRKSSTV